MHYLYILFSDKLQKFYVRETHSIKLRIIKHNSHFYKKAFTKAGNDWVVVVSKKLINKENALFLERFIKKMKSKKFILKIIDNPEILDDILKKM